MVSRHCARAEDSHREQVDFVPASVELIGWERRTTKHIQAGHDTQESRVLSLGYTLEAS